MTVNVDIQPITPLDFNIAAVTKEDIETLLESHKTKKLSTIRPKTFFGRVDENPHNFMSHFEAYAKLTSIEGENKCLTFGLMLQDVACVGTRVCVMMRKKILKSLRRSLLTLT